MYFEGMRLFSLLQSSRLLLTLRCWLFVCTNAEVTISYVSMGRDRVNFGCDAETNILLKNAVFTEMYMKVDYNPNGIPSVGPVFEITWTNPNPTSFPIYKCFNAIEPCCEPKNPDKGVCNISPQRIHKNQHLNVFCGLIVISKEGVTEKTNDTKVFCPGCEETLSTMPRKWTSKMPTRPITPFATSKHTLPTRLPFSSSSTKRLASPTSYGASSTTHLLVASEVSTQKKGRRWNWIGHHISLPPFVNYYSAF